MNDLKSQKKIYSVYVYIVTEMTLFIKLRKVFYMINA